MSPSVTRVRSVQKPREQIMNHKVTAEVLGDYRNIQTLSRIANTFKKFAPKNCIFTFTLTYIPPNPVMKD